MCLSVIRAEGLLKELEKKADKNGNVVCYKVLNDDLTSIYQYTQYEYNKVTKSDRKSKKLDEFERYSVDRGIHVILTRSQARKIAKEEHGKVFKVQCNLKDLVAIGIWPDYFQCKSAVFMQVKLIK